MVTIYQIHEDEIPACWPKIEDLLERIFDRMPRTEETIEIFRRLTFKESLCWAISLNDTTPSIDAIVILTVTRNGWLAVDYCAGDQMELWLRKLVEEIDRHAERLKLRGVTITGRKGWGRMVAKDGYEEGLHLFVKILENEP